MPFKSLIRLFSRYLTVAKWLLGESVWSMKGRIIFLSVMSIAAYCSEFGALFFSIAVLKQDPRLAEVFEVAGITSNQTAVSIAIVLFILVCAALFGFASAVQTVRCRRLCQDLLTRKAELILLSNEIPLIPIRKNIAAKAAAIRVLRSDPGMVGWVLMLMLRMFVPLTMTLIVFGYLLFTHTVIGLLIIGLVFVSLPLILLPNKIAASATAKMERFTSKAAQSTQLFLKAVNNENKDTLPLVEMLSPVLNARDQRMVAIQYSRLIGSALLAGVVTLCLVMLLSNTEAFTNDTTTLVAVLATIRLGMTSLRSSSTTVTSINRFYTQIRRFAGFVKGIPIDGFEAGNPQLSVGTKAQSPIPNGSVIGVLTPVNLDHVSAGWITLSLFNRAYSDNLFINNDCLANINAQSVVLSSPQNKTAIDKMAGVNVLVCDNASHLEGINLFTAFKLSVKGKVQEIGKKGLMLEIEKSEIIEKSIQDEDLEMELEMELEM